MAEKFDRVIVKGNYGTKNRETDGVKTRVISSKKTAPSTQHIGKLLTEPTRPDLRGEDPATKKKRKAKIDASQAEKSRLRAAYRGAGWRSTAGGLAM